jgi:predicted amidohydrolase YtcJ
MAATGLTGGHVMDLADADVELYRDLDEAGDLPLRLRIAPWCRPGDTTERIDQLIAAQQQRGQVWAVAGVKLFIDGTIDGGTAWLSQPDRNGESITCYWNDPEQYTRAVHRLAAAGVPTATHAIGDAGVRHVLDTIAGAPARTTAPHRVEHIETLPDDQLPRFAAIGAIASMQPTHATEYTSADFSDNWSSRIGPERAAQGWRCGDLIRAGATVVFGSDWPVAHYDPRGVLAAAQTRRPVGHPDRPAVGADQAVTSAQALSAYTRAPAIAAADHAGGRIALGARADLTVFAADPIKVAAPELTTLPVRLTVMDGIIRHRMDDP